MTKQYLLTVNGKTSVVTTAPHRSLLDTLRQELGLTGSKKGCDEGECASCTVLLDGVPVNSCLVLVGDAAGKLVVTIEGVADAHGPHPLQKAFVDLGGVQCGYCTSGMIVSACALLREQPDPSDEDIKFYLAGNICRCTGYNKITAAVRSAAETMRAAAGPLCGSLTERSPRGDAHSGPRRAARGKETLPTSQASDGISRPEPLAGSAPTRRTA